MAFVRRASTVFFFGDIGDKKKQP